MAQLSEWLELMMAEIARKQDDAQRGVEEEALRRHSASPGAATGVSTVSPGGASGGKAAAAEARAGAATRG